MTIRQKMWNAVMWIMAFIGVVLIAIYLMMEEKGGVLWIGEKDILQPYPIILESLQKSEAQASTHSVETKEIAPGHYITPKDGGEPILITKVLLKRGDKSAKVCIIQPVEHTESCIDKGVLYKWMASTDVVITKTIN